MSLTTEEKSLIQESLQIYIQVIAQQMGQQQAQGIAQMARDVLLKLDTLSAGAAPGGKPNGISDEWFNDVCTTCDKLSPAGCDDKVTLKFPGKCDPILKYEQKKFMAARQAAI